MGPSLSTLLSFSFLVTVAAPTSDLRPLHAEEESGDALSSQHTEGWEAAPSSGESSDQALQASRTVKPQTSKANVYVEFLGLLTTNSVQILMSLERSCWALAILLAIVDFQRSGCIHVTSSVSQKGRQLDFTCTLQFKKDEDEGLILFWCKDRPRDCSPETSLEQLMVKRDPGTDGILEQASQLVFTIEQATPLDSGTYQCCARSQKPEIHIQGHFFSVLVTGNHTEIRQRQMQDPGFSHMDNTLSSGFLKVKAWEVLVISLVVLQAL